jgi:EpsI family protein
MVGLFLGVYRTQRHGAELVTSANIMVDEKHPMWSDTMVRPRRVGLSSGELALEQHLLSSRRGERLLVWTWYLVGDRHTSNPYLAKLLEAKSRLLGHRGEAALIAVAAPYDERPETAASVLTSFVDAMLPAIEAEVERALRAES